MRTIRERRFNAIVGLDHAIDGVRSLFSADQPAGFDWPDLVDQMRTAVAVLRSAEDDNEQR